MSQSELVKICAPPVISSNASIREWLLVFAELFLDRDGLPRKITPALISTYERALIDIPAEQLNVALELVPRRFKFFPMPAEIRELVEQADAGGFELAVEQEWQRLLDYVRKYFLPDMGLARDAPPLPAAVEFAAQAAGGFRWLESCPESELQWARKRFIETYTRVHATHQVEHLLTRGEAKRLVSQLASGACVTARVLEAPQPTAEETATDDGDVAESLRRARESVNRPPAPRAVLSPEEIERRKRDQLERFAQYLGERGQHAAVTVPAKLRGGRRRHARKTTPQRPSATNDQPAVILGRVVGIPRRSHGDPGN